MLKNKGFVLMEAFVVIVVISISLLTLFASYNKILSKLKEENKYDLTEYLYKTYYIREHLRDSSKCNSVTVYSIGDPSVTVSPKNYLNQGCSSSSNYVSNKFSSFGVKRVYILDNINGTQTNDNLKHFDAYMIDYIRQLDVDDNQSLIIVEYSKTARDINYNPLKLYEYDPTNSIDDINLEETYIASLEW